MSHLKLKWRSLFQSGHERVTVSAEVSFFFFFISFQTSYYILVSAGINSMTIYSFFFCQFLIWNDVYIIPCVYVFFFRLLLFGDSLFGSSCAIVSIDPFRPLWLVLFLFFASSYFILFASFSTLLWKKEKTKERKNKFPIAFFCVCCCWPVLAPVGLLVAFVSNVPAIRLSSAAQSYVSVRSCLSSEILDGFIDLTALWVWKTCSLYTTSK